ncbi:hypothetical protein BsIDN1_15510 [Bacillus safensis]|uniref:Uncharacterized protein n=1 Tax=Bacillus safensis TaxID=561879 RepID=A0A5S9M460_BACIA|nr:hypothetical protein BsIDN1_15510 [Bacillus safensis]
MPPTRGEQLIQQLETQAKTFEPEIALNQKITSFERDEHNHIILTAENGDRHLTKTLILAMVTAFQFSGNLKSSMQTAMK